jgi:hypothetical protein
MNTRQTGNIQSNPLVRHLTIVLVVKLLLLTLLWWLFFRSPDSGVSERVDVGTHIAGPATHQYQP